MRSQIHFPFAGESGRPLPLYSTTVADLRRAMEDVAERREDAEAIHLARKISPDHIAGTLCGAHGVLTLNEVEATCRHCLATEFNERQTAA